MKRAITRISIFTWLTIFTSSAFASDDPDGFYVWADVVDVDPIVTTHSVRTPTTHCRVVDEQPRRIVRDRRRKESILPALFGSVIGGVIGNQFGGGNGKRAMTVIGALTGASIASSAQDHSHRYVHHQPREVCRASYQLEQVDEVSGYHVTYRYLGHDFEKVTEEHPGRRLRVYVTVSPVAQSPAYI